MIKKIKSNIIFYNDDYKSKGFKGFINARLIKIIDFLNYYYLSAFTHNTFIFLQKEYSYKLSRYNYTWKNERAVEIPIIWDIVRNNKNKKILEVGNVLSHYYPIKHDVLDKYEKAPGVINKDAVNVDLHNSYDVIISISTFEHVGWDEEKKDDKKILKMISNLKKYLNKNGEIIFTVPLGYNPHLDNFIKENKISIYKKFFLKRITKNNIWKEVNSKELKNVKYNYPYPNANVICYGIIKN